MKFIRFLFSLSITLAICYGLDNKWDQIPPLGKFLDPFNGFWQNAGEKSMELGETIELEGLNSPVTVKYDQFLIPHIFAKNNSDLFKAQGYVTAVNRLWQMDFQVMASAGRLSEVVGPVAINYDRLQRRKGMTFGAEKSAEKMVKDYPELAGFYNDFSAGANAYINSLSYADLPVEYKLLDYWPEPWSMYKFCLLIQYMVDDLSGHDQDLENTNALELFGKETYDMLFPDYLPGIDPVVPTVKPWEFEPVPIAESDSLYPSIMSTEVLPKADPDNGSNNWAVSGEKTESGNPILANDTHLGLNLPSIWYMLQLQSPDLNVMGFTFTGMIGITIGFNDSTAWAFTNAPRDGRDWYYVEFKDQNKREYLHEGKWLVTQARVEKIKVRGEDPFIDTVYYTHHGPIVYDETFAGSGENLALRWIGHNPTDIAQFFYIINQGNNLGDYQRSLRYFNSAPQNAIFASSGGDIAITVGGKFPLKWKDQGKFIMDGRKHSHDWQGYIPTEHNPQIVNPEWNFLSSANQHSVDTLYPYYFYNSNLEYYRNLRINQLLRQNNGITPQDFMEMHLDDYSALAAMSLPLLLDSLDSASLDSEQNKVFELLKAWDYQYSEDALAPIYFDAWTRELFYSIWDEFQHDSLELAFPTDFNTLYLIKNYPDHPFFDVASTPEKETINQLITESFGAGLDKVAEWQAANETELSWPNYRGARVNHLLRLGPFSSDLLSSGGHPDVINAITYSSKGPSQRMVVELGPKVKAWASYPGGQSGNPGSEYYDNLIPMYNKGQYFDALLMKDPEANPDRILFTQTLTPPQ